MKTIEKKVLSVMLTLMMVSGIVIYGSTTALAVSSKSGKFKTSYTLTGNGATDIVNVAVAQGGLTNSTFGYEDNWCSAFVSDCAKLAGQGSAVPWNANQENLKTAVINAGGTQIYKKTGSYSDAGFTDAKVGDLVFINWNNSNASGTEHVEIVYKVSSGKIYTVGGNTDAGVKVRTRNTQNGYEKTVWVVRPKYSSSTPTPSAVTAINGLQSSYYVGETVSVSWAQSNNTTYYAAYLLNSDGYIEAMSNTTTDRTCSFQLNKEGTFYIQIRSISANKSVTTLSTKWSFEVRSSTPCTTHTKGAYQYYWAAHPHYKCYKCTVCGKVFNTTETTYVSSCSTCSSHTHVKGAYQYYWAAHPHYKCYKCTVCGETYNTSETTYLSSCSTCTAKPVVTVTAGTSTTNTTIKYTKNTMASRHDLHIYNSDGSRYTLIGDVGTTKSLILPKGTYSIYIVAAIGDNLIWSDKKSVTINDPSYKLTINYYSNYADKAFSGSANTVSADKNVIVKTAPVGYADTVTYGLPDYSYDGASTYLGRTGYTATGYWNTKPDGSGYRLSESEENIQGYQIAKKLGVDISTGNKTINLYPEWTANTYIVKYDANGGSGVPANQTKTYGQTLTLSSTKPTRSGYTFKNWNTKANGTGTSYSAGASYTANAAVTLYAQWTQNVPTTYTLTYNANGGSGVPSSQTGNGSITLSSAKPTRSGYTFLGWTTNASATTAQYQPGASYNLTANTTLYAVWKKIDTTTAYTLTYNANGGTGAPAAQTGNGNITLSSAKPTRSGYAFLGWATKASATAAQYQPGASFNLTANTTLYAVWKKVETPPAAQPTVTIRNYTANKSVDYKTTMTFTAITTDAPAGSAIHWFINGSDKGTGETYTVKQATSDYTVQVKLIGADGSVLAQSATETVKVSNGFFARLIAFFRQIFGSLPVISQSVKETL